MSGILREFIKDEIEEERKKAVLEVKKSMAVNLSAQGVDIEIISKAAEVSKDTVEEWLKDGLGWPQKNKKKTTPLCEKYVDL